MSAQDCLESAYADVACRRDGHMMCRSQTEGTENVNTEVVVHRSLDSREAESQWERAVGRAGPVLSADWLRSVEGWLSSQAWYLTTSTHSSAAALAAFALDGGSSSYHWASVLCDDERWKEIGRHLSDTEQQQATAARAAVAASAPSFYPALTCVSPFGYRVAIGHQGGEGISQARTLLRHFDKLASSARSACLLYVDEELNSELATGLTGYHRVLLSFNAVLQMQFRSFDHYLARQGKSRSSVIRREMREFASTGGTVESYGADVLIFEREALGALAIETDMKYGGGMTPAESRQIFDRIVNHLGGQTSVFVARAHGHPVAFVVVYVRNGEWQVANYGRSYELGIPKFAYFNTVYYAVIKAAIAAQAQTVVFGAEAFEAKRSRGCDIVPRWGYVRATSGAQDALEHLVRLWNAGMSRRLDSMRGSDL